MEKYFLEEKNWLTFIHSILRGVQIYTHHYALGDAKYTHTYHTYTKKNLDERSVYNKVV